MCKVRLYLNPADKEGYSPVFICFTFKGKKKRYYLRIKIKEKDIDKAQKKQRRLRVKNQVTGSDITNIRLDQCEGMAREIINRLLIEDKNYSFEEVCRQFEAWLKPSKSMIASVNDVFELWLEHLKISKNKEGTIRAKKKILNKINAVYTGDFSNDFLDRFYAYLVASKYETSYIKKVIVHLKEFIRFGFKYGFSEDVLKWQPKFKLDDLDKEGVSVTQAEYDKIYKSNPSTEHLQLISDIAIVFWNTGQHYADTNISEKDIYKDMVNGFRQKTGNRFTVPITADLQEVFDKYKGKVPRLTLKDTNDGLKALFTELEITREVRLEYNKAGVVSYEKKPLNKVISTKIMGRNSASTILAENNIDPGMIAKFLGQKSVKTQNVYKNMSEKNAENIKDSLKRKG